MYKLGILILALVLVASTVMAQDTTPKTKEGDHAFLFQFSGLSNLNANNYLGGAGIRWYFDDMMALRVGVNFGTTSAPTPGYNPNASPQTLNEKTTNSSYGINVGLQKDFATSGAVVAYYGAQVSWLGTSLGSQTVSGSSTTQSTFGVAVLAGVEWFPWANVSLSPEYQLGFTSTGAPSVSGASYTPPATTSFNLASTGFLTLSFYF
jgi:opacity protein-like surface antigen